MPYPLKTLISVLATASIALMLAGCGGGEHKEEGSGPLDDFPIDTSPPSRVVHPPKPTIESYAQCSNWHDKVRQYRGYIETQWPLQEHKFLITSFWVTGQPVDGIDYRPCVLAEIFAKAELVVSDVDYAVKSMPVENQIDREDVAIFLSAIYEEPSALLTLKEIAIAPHPNFDESYIALMGERHVEHAEMRIRVAAVNAIGFTAPASHDDDDDAWVNALLEIVEEAYRKEIALTATWELRNLGVTKQEFNNSTSHLDDSLREYLTVNTIWNTPQEENVDH